MQFRLTLCLSLLWIGHPLVAADSDDTEDTRSINPGDRPRKASRSIRPRGEPEPVADAEGRATSRRRSRLDLRQFLLEDLEESVEVQLMSDEPAEVFPALTRDDKDDDPFEAWRGKDEDTGHTLTMVKSVSHDGISNFAGTLSGSNGTIYQIRQLADRDVIVEQVPQNMFDKEYEGALTDVEGGKDVDPTSIDQIDGLRQNQRNLRRLDSSSVIDMMVVFTKGAMCSAAGYASGGSCSASPSNLAVMNSLINLAISETNAAYANSGIATKLRLVKTHYDDTYNDYSSTWETTLANIRNNGDGILDYVHAMRTQYGADFVSMMVDTGSYCGIGYRPDTPSAGDAFSLVQWSCATGYYSFGHELAHNMGCNHDRANSGGGPASNYGYQYNSGSSYDARFRSIMAYDCPGGCKREQFFSSPNRLFKGRPTGDSGANNAQWIADRLSSYANFRQSVPTGPVIQAVPTRAPTPAPTVYVPTGPPTNAEYLETTLGGGFVGGAGNIFDVRAKKDLTVSNFAVHSYAATTVTVEIWKKKTTGTSVGSQSDINQWQQLGQATFTSGNAYTPSILPQGSFPPVFIKAGDVQAFYVTFSANTNYNRYSSGTNLGSVQASNNDMEVLEGYAKGYRFGDDYYPRIWNGRVYYEVGTKSPEPTKAPTQRPTNAPTDKPSSAPTDKPTNEPTDKPTNAPTPAPTPPPTASPTDRPVSDPTSPPTPSPTQEPTMPPTPSPTTRAPIPAPTSDRPSRSPTGANQAVEELITTFAGGNGQAGNMFEIKASQKIVVTTFDIHTYSNANVHVYVYAKKGTYVGFEQDRSAWTEICDTWVKGAGSPKPTPIPEADVDDISIEAGETYSFYITLTESKIRYTNGVVAADDGVVSIINSSGMKYPFGPSYANRVWNGVLYYKTNNLGKINIPTTLPKNQNGPSKEVQTTFANRNGSYGNMFDVKALEDLIVHNFWIHTYHRFGALVDVEVYKLKEAGQSYAGNEMDKSKWELIGKGQVEGAGTGYATKMPPGMVTEVEIAQGTKQAFYVTIVGGGIRYSNGASVNTMEVAASNSDIIIYEGAGVGAPRFGGTFFPRVFNGVLEYYTPNVAVSDSSMSSDSVSGQYEGLGGPKDEGWPCDSPGQCKSRKCGLATSSGESQTLTSGQTSIITSRLSQRGSGRHLKAMDVCLDENGEHFEDGETEEEGTSRM